MPGVADENDLAVLLGVVLPFLVDLRHQRAGRVDGRKAAPFRFLLDRFRNAVGAENGHRALGNVGEFLDEDRALGAQGFDDVAVVDDFVADVDRRPEHFQRALDDLDRALDAGAEPAGLRQKDLQHFPLCVHV